MQGLIERQLPAQTAWEDLFVTDARGIIIASHYRTGVSVADRPYFQQARRRGTPAISDLLVSRLSGHLIINIAEPITRQGRFAGVIVASIIPRRVQEIFSTVPVTSGSIIALWGSDHRLLARSNAPLSWLGRQAPADEAALIFSGGTGTGVIHTMPYGERALIAYTPVQGTSWVIVTGLLYRHVYGPAYYAGIAFAVLSAIVLLGGVWWGVRVTGRISRDYAKLANAAQQIGNGALQTRVALQPDSDLAGMADAINRMAERLEVSERLKFNLITLVSHELKTPLTAIITAEELLPRSEENTPLLGIIKRQSDRLREMIENLINIARAQAGTLTVSARSQALRPLVEAIFSHFIREHDIKALTLTLEIPADLRVYADTQLTSLALHNLLDNAVKFTERGGITVQAHADGDQAVMTVTDSGAGFMPNMLEQFFQPFYMPEALMTRRREGAGLGLAVVKSVIEVQGGHVFAISAGEGQGSVFGFSLPLAKK